MTARNSLIDVPIFVVDARGRSVVGSREDFADVRSKVERIAELAADPSQIVRTRKLLRSIVGPYQGIDAMTAIHEWIALHVEFLPEREQILQSPDHVLARRCGDCTAHAAIGAALARLAGADVVLPTMGGRPGDPEHVSKLVSLVEPSRRMVPPEWVPWSSSYPTFPGWYWSDTSVPLGYVDCAPFGAPPGMLARVSRAR